MERRRKSSHQPNEGAKRGEKYPQNHNPQLEEAARKEPSGRWFGREAVMLEEVDKVSWSQVEEDVLQVE